MKIVSWNINGLRAVLKNRNQDLKAFLDSLNADVICLQETKATRDQLDSSMCAAEGYSAFFSFCKTRSGYSGVVTFCSSSASPVAAEEGLTGLLSDGNTDYVGCYPDWDPDVLSTEQLTALDAEGRAVITEHKCELVSDGSGEGRGGREGEGEGELRRVVVVNVYCPMVAEENMERLDYKLQFYSALHERCSELAAAGKLVLAVGDFNCSRLPIDSAYIQDDPNLAKNSPARDYLCDFLISDPSGSSEVKQGRKNLVKLVDVFRFLHPAQKCAYTCWSTIMECRKTNYGTRIDYITACSELAVGVKRSEVWQQEEGSDHCPVFAEFSLRTFPSDKLPSLCSCNFPELSSKQKKLSAFLVARPKKQEGAGGGNGGIIAAGPSSAKILKRSASMTSQVPPPAKLRKTSSQPAAKSSRNKGSEFFFGKPTSKAETKRDSQSTGSRLSDASIGDTHHQQTGSSSTPPTQLPTSAPLADAQPSVLTNAWKSVFGAPPKPPLCKGHREPCRLMTVKKAGPNKNRQFWRCARPGGSKGDREANCDFFQWASKK